MDISSRKHDENRFKHLAAIYAALGATNEAILHAKTPMDLYQRVCNAAVESGKFLSAAVIIADRGGLWATCEAAAGMYIEKLDKTRVSLDGNTEEGHGLAGIAFRTLQPRISNDFLTDERTRHGHVLAENANIAAGAAIPLLQNDRAIGVLLFYSGEKNAFDDEATELIKRMARNITFALDNFDQDAERNVAAKALQSSEARYRNILENMTDAYVEVDIRGQHVFCNSAFSTLIGYSKAELRGTSNRTHQTPEMILKVGTAFKEVYRTGVQKKNQQWEYLNRNGNTIRVEGSVQLRRDDAGVVIGFSSILRDITERWQMDQALRESEARFRALTNLSSDWYWEQDAEFRLIRMESRHANTASRSHAMLGKKVWEIGFDIQDAGGWAAHQELLAANQPFRDVILHRVNRQGGSHYVSMSGEPVFDNDGRFTGYRGIAREITDQKVAEKRIEYLATHDGLTGLPNRAMFSHLLNIAIPSAARYDRRFAVLFIDLDRFKFINDTLGHEAGDTLLKEITARFKQTLRASDVIARLGGDEFVLLIQELENAEQAATVARKILSAALKPVVLMGQECRVTASIGISMFPDNGETEQMLMKNADIAMYFAKEEGKNNFQFFSKDIKSQSLERMTLESNLRHAMERNELSLHYQAKLNLDDGTITGVEALLRWNSPLLGAISPALFIPIAEETGLIVPIGMWVLKTACAQSVAWQSQGLPPVCIAVNISVRQFADVNLLDDIAAALQESGMAPHLLELEITEGMVVHNPDRAIKLLTSIKKMGVRLAIDDFGTGYSSLAQLKRFPIDTLKVDRSFIRDIATNSEDKAITQAIIAMGKTLSLTVVAEGVETMEQEAFLRKHLCDQMQGFYFSKPVIAEEFAALLRDHVPARQQ